MYYTPSNWYWVVAGSTTEVFASARSAYVSSSDATYLAWIAAGNRATNIDTEANLIGVLAEAAPGVTVPSVAGLIAYTQAKQAAIASGGISVNVGSTSFPTMVEASTSVSGLTLLNSAVAVAAANPSATTAWVPSTGNPITLNAAQVQTISGTVVAFIQATFTTAAAVITAINAGTITTKAGVDTPPSPIPAWPVNS